MEIQLIEQVAQKLLVVVEEARISDNFRVDRGLLARFAGRKTLPAMKGAGISGKIGLGSL